MVLVLLQPGQSYSVLLGMLTCLRPPNLQAVRPNLTFLDPQLEAAYLRKFHAKQARDVARHLPLSRKFVWEAWRRCLLLVPGRCDALISFWMLLLSAGAPGCRHPHTGCWGSPATSNRT